MRNTFDVSRNDMSAWRRFSSATRQLSIVIKPFWTTRNAILVLNLLDAEARRSFILNDETFDLIVSEVARPNNRKVAPGSIADPFLLTVEHPSVAVALRGRRQAATGSGTH